MSKDTPDLPTTTGPSPQAAPGTPEPVVPARVTTDVNERYAVDRDGDGEEGDVVVVVADLAIDPLRPSLAARLGAEALGTFFLVLVGLGILLYSALSGAASLGVALGFGLALIGATIAFGRVSGGHFNPAVTIGAAIAGRTPWRDVLPYWLAQIAGGALAAAALYLTIPGTLAALVAQGDPAATTRSFFALTANGFGDSSPLSTLSTGQASFDLLPALLIEIIATALLVGVVLASTSRRAQLSLAPVAIGLTYAVLVLLASPITNAGLNPARSTAAALFSGGDAFGQLWLFWVAPVVGAALAGLAYRAFAAEPLEDDLLAEDLLTNDLLANDAVRA